MMPNRVSLKMVQINNKGYILTLERQVALGDGNTQESVSTWTFSICILQEPISVSDQNTANTRYYAVTKRCLYVRI